MCGIVGIWASKYEKDHLRSDMEKAISSLRHRGPDDSGLWMNDVGVALGHTRLSILDLSPLGHQPMKSKDGRYVIIFNGEIYNFADIRGELSLAGHVFTGSGDTEVILHAFAEWGSAAVDRFIGMFAIALWDEQQKLLQLFRDRIGVKPLYFSWDGSGLCFASELKALRHFRHWSPEIDTESLGEFLQYGYIPDDRSIYRDVYKLRPGHQLRLEQGQAPVVEPYWSILGSIQNPLTGTDQDIEIELEALLVDAIKYRMVSDVPVGIFLSGGIDSSLVTALLAKHYQQTIQTFTIGFTEESHDESKWARKVANYCGTSHTEYILESSEAVAIARDWGHLFDEPFADSSSIPTLLVSRLASQDVKVVLSADGGDELFSGYNAYTTVLKRLARLSSLPTWGPSILRRILSIIPQSVTDPLAIGNRQFSGATPPLTMKMGQLRDMLELPTPGGLIDYSMSHLHPHQIERLLVGYSRKEPAIAQYPGDAVTQIALRDFHHYLPGDILTKVDRTTMAASIEGREPLLDHRLAEFAFRLPAHLKRGSLGPKHILKSILYRLIPSELVDRPKQGFAIPKAAWLRADLRELVEDYLSNDRLQAAGIFNVEMVKQIKDNFYSGNDYLTEVLWYILVFEMWRDRWE